LLSPSTHRARPAGYLRRIQAHRLMAASVAMATAVALLSSAESSVATRSSSRMAGKSLVDSVSTGNAALSKHRIILGAVGNRGGLANRIHHRLAHHTYRDFSQAVPGGRMVTAGSTLTWRRVANMSPGSQIHQDVVRWAHVLGRRAGPTLFAFSHEPEISSKIVKGNAVDFKRAFRKVVTVMRTHGARSVRFTWQMTGWSFRVNPSSRMRAQKWYPGDRWVNVVGPDEYNWFTCGEGVGNWVSLGAMARPALHFAMRHHKLLAIPEFASLRNPRRANWVRSAHEFLARNRNHVMAAFYFQHAPTNPANRDCSWKLNRLTEYRALRTMARHNTVFRS
jgi:hypothetical protein